MKTIMLKVRKDSLLDLINFFFEIKFLYFISGEIYFDDGESIIKEQNHEFTFVEAKTKDDQLILRPVVSKYQIRPSIEKIKIVGVNLRESLNFYLNGNKINSKNVNQVNSNTIEIEGLKIDLNKTNRINWN